MGIVNTTPDSFSDGGLAFYAGAAVDRALQLEAEGADLLDIGGESTRPGSDPVPEAEELRRVLPVLEGLAGLCRVPLSVDTSKAEVARRAIAAGASVINDIGALALDPLMAEVVADSPAGLVLMHMKGTPRTMQQAPHYDDVVDEVLSYLADRVDFAERAGIPRRRIAVDPGIGFGKTTRHNLELLWSLHRLRELGCAVLVGTSRKRFLGELTGRAVGDRQAASVASALAAIEGGADLVRVHDVAPLSDTLKVWTAQRQGWPD
jgi:dihydropteroate synthase